MIKPSHSRAAGSTTEVGAPEPMGREQKMALDLPAARIAHWDNDEFRLREGGVSNPGESANADQVDDEYECLVGADDATGAALAVGKHRRNRDPPPAPRLHTRHALIPPSDNLALAETELERLAAIP